MLQITQVSDEDMYKVINYHIVEGGRVIGYASVMVDDESAYCERIDIEQEFRNRGYGTAALLAMSAVHGGVIVAPDNEDARRLYERIGTEANADIYDQGHGVYKI